MSPLVSLVIRYRDTDSLGWELVPLEGEVVGVVEGEDVSTTALTLEGSEFRRQQLE
jgi:hypothetical protein